MERPSSVDNKYRACGHFFDDDYRADLEVYIDSLEDKVKEMEPFYEEWVPNQSTIQGLEKEVDTQWRRANLLELTVEQLKAQRKQLNELTNELIDIVKITQKMLSTRFDTLAISQHLEDAIKAYESGVKDGLPEPEVWK